MVSFKKYAISISFIDQPPRQAVLMARHAIFSPQFTEERLHEQKLSFYFVLWCSFEDTARLTEMLYRGVISNFSDRLLV